MAARKLTSDAEGPKDEEGAEACPGNACANESPLHGWVHEGYIPQPMDAFVLGAFAAFYGSNLIRALPWPEAWKQRKPLACPLCLAGWLCIVGWLLGTHWLIAAAAAGGALLLEEIRDRLKGASWGLPPS